MMAAILDSAIFHKNKPSLIQFWLNLMMAAILNSAMFTFGQLGFSHFSQNSWTQTNSFWLKLIHSHLTWWWQPSWTLPGSHSDTAILDSDTLLSSLRFTQKHCSSSILPLWLKLIQSDSNSFILTQLDDGSWYWILPFWIQPFCTKKNLHSFILTQLDDGCHLEFCHV